MKPEGTGRYESIINLPHHQSATRPHMPMSERAAQFSPFAALSGHSEAIEETQRLTEGWQAPSEDEAERLDALTRELLERLTERPEIRVTFFRPDERKPGGSYITRSGRLRHIDTAYGKFIMADGYEISMAYITDISIL